MAKPPESTVAEVPVLIVGAGPSGLALSLSLCRHGVDHQLVERHAGTRTRLVRTSSTSGRSRSFGVFA